MTYTIAKQNIGSPRTYKTQAALERALVKAGAHRMKFDHGFIHIEWREGVISYAVDEQGNVDQQLAWDMEV
jgi:hypothetical protein